MLPMSWNGSNGVVHFLVTAARKSLTVCACAPVARNASAHSAAVSFFMVCLPGLFLQIVLVVLIGRGLCVAGRQATSCEVRQQRSHGWKISWHARNNRACPF